MKRPHRSKMYAVMRNDEPYIILPDIDAAETHLGLWSKNGFSKHRWEIKPVTVSFVHETPAERRKRTSRHVQAVIALNQSLAN